MSREVKWIGGGMIQVFDDPWPPGGKGYRARLFTWTSRLVATAAARR
jgi:hypothetical protein